MEIKYPQIGVCGLSCKLCPMYQSAVSSRCEGCKSETRMKLGCQFITCAVKRKAIEFCWECSEGSCCESWKKHREAGRVSDSFKCYQKLEKDIEFINDNGMEVFMELQNKREKLLKEMLDKYNEGRSKSYYCIAATVMEPDELEEALNKAEMECWQQDIKTKARVLHRLLDEIAANRGYILKLRKGV